MQVRRVDVEKFIEESTIQLVFSLTPDSASFGKSRKVVSKGCTLYR